MKKKIRKHEDRDAIAIPPEFRLEEDLAAAYHYMEFTDNSLFLTGKAGTGKSSLLNYFRKNTSKKNVVLAPTGLAALHVGGSTIHSFFGFPLRPLLKNDPEIRPWTKGHPKSRVINKMQVLIIDEISMVRADVLDAIDYTLRINTNIDLPFGGKQVIFIGDIFQLAPVVVRTGQSYEDENSYESPYFFSADAFRSLQPSMIELKKIYRQHDENFIYLLNRIRSGIATTDDFDEINRCYRDAANIEDDFTITLSSVNAIADMVNQKNLMALTGQLFTFTASVDGNFPEKLYPTVSRLTLKEGAQVMMVKNDLKGRWVNGSIGKIESLEEKVIKVRFQDGVVHEVEPVSWENKSYTWDKTTNTIAFVTQGTYIQHPIRLAWAVTIHKSQGLTFDKVIIDMGRGAFAHGQLYVALSRCKTLQGISLRTAIQLKDMIVDEVVEYFAGKHRIG